MKCVSNIRLLDVKTHMSVNLWTNPNTFKQNGAAERKETRRYYIYVNSKKIYRFHWMYSVFVCSLAVFSSPFARRSVYFHFNSIILLMTISTRRLCSAIFSCSINKSEGKAR